MSTRSTFRRAALGATVSALLLVTAAPALAHGDAAQGDLAMTIGFGTEPAFSGQPNSVQLVLEHGGQPVTDLKPGDVSVEVGFGDETSEPMEMEPNFFFDGGTLVFGEAGDYRAYFTPSQAGEYTFHFTGMIDGEEIDETMSSGPKTFADVADIASTEFPPVQAPSNEELATRIDQESARTQESVSAAEAAAASADDAASSARIVGLVGVVLGALGVIAAIAALASSRRRTA